MKLGTRIVRLEQRLGHGAADGPTRRDHEAACAVMEEVSAEVVRGDLTRFCSAEHQAAIGTYFDYLVDTNRCTREQINRAAAELDGHLNRLSPS